jgi:T1SS-143 domain-containing protein
VIGAPVDGGVDEGGLVGDNAGNSDVTTPPPAPDRSAVREQIASSPDEGVDGQETTATGSLDISWGADDNNVASQEEGSGAAGALQTAAEADRSVAFDSNQPSFEGLTSNGEAVKYGLNEDGTILTATAGIGGSTVFSVSLSDLESGSYNFSLLETLDHPPSNTEDDLNLEFNFTATDSDGDTASSSFTVMVEDSSLVTITGVDIASNISNLSIFAGTYVTSGDAATISDGIMAGTAITTGANSEVDGDMFSGTYTTTGAAAQVSGSILSGTTITTGADSEIDGVIGAGGVITLGANSSSQAQVDFTAGQMSTEFEAGLKYVKDSQEAFEQMGNGTVLAAVMGGDTKLSAGVYSAGSFSTTEGITLTLDGGGQANQVWVFNITNILKIGAKTIVNIENAENATVIWNVTNGYAAIGADAQVVGTFYAKNYITVGANTEIDNSNGASSGLFAHSGYVQLGADVTVGKPGSGHSNENLVTGTALADSEVTLYDASGSVIGTTDADTSGNFSYTLNAVDIINVAAAGKTITASIIYEGNEVTSDPYTYTYTQHGSVGYDTLKGGAGNDSVFGGAGNDSLFGGAGNDALFGDEGNDSLKGGEGEDNLSGNKGNDNLSGGEGEDSLSGDEGNDILSGGKGDDRLSGDEGEDTLNGYKGHYILTGGEGNDILSGGEGSDIFVWNDGDAGTTDTPAYDIVKDFNPNEDHLDLSDMLTDFSGDIADYITVTAGDNGDTVLNVTPAGDDSGVTQQILLQGTQVTLDDLINNIILTPPVDQ